MDLDYLYHRRQISLVMADKAATEAARRVHLGLAEAYAERIATVENAEPSDHGG